MRICAEVSLLPPGLGWVNLVGIRSSALMRLSIVLISDMGEADHIYIPAARFCAFEPIRAGDGS